MGIRKVVAYLGPLELGRSSGRRHDLAWKEASLSQGTGSPLRVLLHQLPFLRVEERMEMENPNMPSGKKG